MFKIPCFRNTDPTALFLNDVLGRINTFKLDDVSSTVITVKNQSGVTMSFVRKETIDFTIDGELIRPWDMVKVTFSAPGLPDRTVHYNTGYDNELNKILRALRVDFLSANDAFAEYQNLL